MIVFDIETNGLLDQLTVIHCINMIDRETGERLRFNNHPDRAGRPPDGTILDGLRRLSEAPEIAGHNIVNFDVPALQKIYPTFKPKGEIHDTLVYSRVVWTDLKDIDFKAIKRRKRPDDFLKRNLTGRHSLEAWGYRLVSYKGDYGPKKEAEGKALGLTRDALVDYVWGTFNPEMDDYCEQDCEVTLKLLEKIEDQGYSYEALKLEMDVAQIIDLQEKHGFMLDIPAAEALAAEMTATQAELDRELRAAFKPWYAPVVEKGRIVTKTPTRKVWLKGVTSSGEVVKRSVDAGWAHCPVQLVEFEPSSRQKIANRLTSVYGWEPQEFTPSGQPKIDETTLDALAYPEVSLLKDYLIVSKALGFLATGEKALLKMVKPDGRIHGRVNSNGAVTGRMTHSDPNVAQVAKVKVDKDGNILKGIRGGYGYELRSLFTVPKGKKLVGVDAEGLELRMLSHYMARYDGGKYADTVVNGDKKDGTDVHSVNRDLVGLNTRDNAKTWKYAYLYGAGNWKLGFTAYEDMGDNKRAAFNAKYPPGKAKDDALSRLGATGRRKIEQGLPALGALQAAVQEKAKTGYLRGLDGRKLRVRGMHSALNTLLQSGGAIVMKKALVLAYEEFLARGWTHGKEFAFVANVHDEFQIEAEEHLAEEIGSIAAAAIRRAGEAFNLRCPLAGSKDIGIRWSDTH
ncbi:DNA polymerase [Novosphingobium meiothermophilum]|uniref:DNA polymerase n=1 Tax=Novosphingobium meiothermophilum TaxID=2202251 RepID=UPI000D6E9E9E|nr:DNA polymerase [Novosphingobium meiothermophilum]